MLTVILSPALPPMSVDPDRLQQIAGNLVSNAIKFTPAGGRVEVLLDQAAGDMRLASAIMASVSTVKSPRTCSNVSG